MGALRRTSQVNHLKGVNCLCPGGRREAGGKRSPGRRRRRIAYHANSQKLRPSSSRPPTGAPLGPPPALVRATTYQIPSRRTAPILFCSLTRRPTLSLRVRARFLRRYHRPRRSATRSRPQARHLWPKTSHSMLARRRGPDRPALQVQSALALVEQYGPREITEQCSLFPPIHSRVRHSHHHLVLFRRRNTPRHKNTKTHFSLEHSSLHTR